VTGGSFSVPQDQWDTVRTNSRLGMFADRIRVPNTNARSSLDRTFCYSSVPLSPRVPQDRSPHRGVRSDRVPSGQSQVDYDARTSSVCGGQWSTGSEARDQLFSRHTAGDPCYQTVGGQQQSNEGPWFSEHQAYDLSEHSHGSGHDPSMQFRGHTVTRSTRGHRCPSVVRDQSWLRQRRSEHPAGSGHPTGTPRLAGSS
jgi:hypothetical protein